MTCAVLRFCFVRLHPEPSAHRDQLARELEHELTRVCAPHPVWAGVPGDDSAARWDLAFTIELPDLAAWQALEQRAALAEVLSRLQRDAAVVKAWTFSRPLADAVTPERS